MTALSLWSRLPDGGVWLRTGAPAHGRTCMQVRARGLVLVMSSYFSVRDDQIVSLTVIFNQPHGY